MTEELESLLVMAAGAVVLGIIALPWIIFKKIKGKGNMVVTERNQTIPVGAIICPKCKKVYDNSWKVCANDGEKLIVYQGEKDIDSNVTKKSTTVPAFDKNAISKQIEELSKLKEKGILSQDEFDGKKKELLERL